MATNHTTNYALNLWEPTDSFVREEFNENTNKIEAAFFNHPSAEVILTQTMEQEGITWWELDLSQVDWSRYFMVCLSVEAETEKKLKLVTGNGQDNCLLTYIGFSSVSSEASSVAAGLGVKRYTAIFFPFYSENTYPLFLGWGGGHFSKNIYSSVSLSAGSTDTQLKDIPRFRLHKSDEAFNIGDKITLWGVK